MFRSYLIAEVFQNKTDYLVFIRVKSLINFQNLYKITVFMRSKNITSFSG